MIVNGLRIYWTYDKHIQRTMSCTILMDAMPLQIIATATAIRSDKDRFDREKGRRISLDKALRSSKMSSYLRSNGPLNEEQIRRFRGQVWEAYRTMTKVPRWGSKITN